MSQQVRNTEIVQKSAFTIFGRPDFLPTTARLLCQTPHLGIFCAFGDLRPPDLHYFSSSAQSSASQHYGYHQALFHAVAQFDTEKRTQTSCGTVKYLFI